MSGPPPIRVRPARADELPGLSALCLRSKALWGYDAAFLDACRADLTIAAEDLAASHVAVADEGGMAVGVVQVAVDGDEADLLKLFVEPSRARHGVGRELFDHARRVAAKLGAVRLVIEADPGAVPFYERMGGRIVGAVPSASIPGRSLPKLVLDL